MYAHRNEDVVNMRPTLHGKQDAIHVGDPSYNAMKTVDKKKSETHSKEQKWNEYKNIAQFMGMSVLDFSKWILCASPSDLEEMLQNYKKKRKRSKG